MTIVMMRITMKTMMKALRAHCTKNMWGILPFSEAPKIKKVNGALTKYLDRMLFAEVGLPPHAEWASKVFQRQLSGAQRSFMNVTMTHFLH